MKKKNNDRKVPSNHGIFENIQRIISRLKKYFTVSSKTEDYLIDCEKQRMHSLKK